MEKLFKWVVELQIITVSQDLRNAHIVIATGTECREAIPASGGITLLSLVMTELPYFCVSPVSIKDEYIEVLTALGDLQESMDLALKQYTLDKIAAKITELRQRDNKYQEKYQLDYSRFKEKVSEDEAFIKHIENSVDKVWEIDLADWEFCHKGVEDWIQKLQTILLTR